MEYKYTKTFTHGGKRYYVRGNTLSEVARKMVEKQKALEASAVKETNITVRDWGERCIELYKTNQTEETRKKFEKRVEKTIYEPIGSFPVRSVSQEQCQLVMNLQTGKSRTHINEVYYALKFLFSHAVIAGIIAQDPTANITKPKKKKSDTRRPLTEIERTAFLSCAAKERKYYGFLLSYYCGCRPGEAGECTGSDLIERDGLHLLHIRGTKTASADRFVPVPSELWELIKTTPKAEFIAIYPSGYPCNYDNRARLWAGLKYKMNIEAGAESYRNRILVPVIGEDLVPYCLRHDYCTRLARAGVDIRTAQKLMGHASITMTANIYTHVETEDLATAANLIEKSATVSATPK